MNFSKLTKDIVPALGFPAGIAAPLVVGSFLPATISPKIKFGVAAIAGYGLYSMNPKGTLLSNAGGGIFGISVAKFAGSLLPTATAEKYGLGELNMEGVITGGDKENMENVVEDYMDGVLEDAQVSGNSEFPELEDNMSGAETNMNLDGAIMDDVNDDVNDAIMEEVSEELEEEMAEYDS